MVPLCPILAKDFLETLFATDYEARGSQRHWGFWAADRLRAPTVSLTSGFPLLTLAFPRTLESELLAWCRPASLF